jgi:hypothetical protein
MGVPLKGYGARQHYTARYAALSRPGFENFPVLTVPPNASGEDERPYRNEAER